MINSNDNVMLLTLTQLKCCTKVTPEYVLLHIQFRMQMKLS